MNNLQNQQPNFPQFEGFNITNLLHQSNNSKLYQAQSTVNTNPKGTQILLRTFDIDYFTYLQSSNYFKGLLKNAKKALIPEIILLKDTFYDKKLGKLAVVTETGEKVQILQQKQSFENKEIQQIKALNQAILILDQLIKVQSTHKSSLLILNDYLFIDNEKQHIAVDINGCLLYQQINLNPVTKESKSDNVSLGNILYPIVDQNGNLKDASGLNVRQILQQLSSQDLQNAVSVKKVLEQLQDGPNTSKFRDNQLTLFQKSLNHLKELYSKMKISTNLTQYQLNFLCIIGDNKLFKQQYSKLIISQTNPKDINSMFVEDYYHPFITIIRYDNLELFKFLIEEKYIDGISSIFNNMPPFLICSFYGSLEIMKFIYTNFKIRPYVKDKYGRTALQISSLHGHLNILQYLVEKVEMDPNLFNQFDQMTSLLQSVQAGNLNLVKYLIEVAKVNLTKKSKRSRNPFLLAAFNGHIDIVKYFINEQKVDPLTQKDNDGSNAIHLASKQGHLSLVKYLHEQMKLEVKGLNKKQNDALFLSAQNYQFQIVKYLIQQGGIDVYAQPTIKAKPYYYRSPYIKKVLSFMQLIPQHFNIEILRYIVQELGIKIKLDQEVNRSPFELACYEGNLEMAKFIAKSFGEENIRVKFNTQLSYFLPRVINIGHLNILKYLLEDLKIIQEKNIPKMLISVYYVNNIDIIKYLLYKGYLDEDLIRNLIQHEILGGRFEIVKFLIEQGGFDPRTLLSNRHTALILAVCSRNMHQIRYFAENFKLDYHVPNRFNETAQFKSRQMRFNKGMDYMDSIM